MDIAATQTELRILLLEDQPTDAELVENALREAGLLFTSRRVDTREAFIQALEEFDPDIILADYKLPAFDGGSAIKIVRQQYPTVPVIMVTGAMGDEKAAELLRLGARDYVLKDRLARLGTAVQKVLVEERDIRARKAAEQALRRERDFSNSLVETAQAIILVLDPQGRIIRFNRFFETLAGCSLNETKGRDWFDTFIPEPDREELRKLFRGAINDIQTLGNVNAILTKGGSQRLIEWYDKTLKDAEGKVTGLIAIGLDVTERKRMEDELKEVLDRNRTIMETANDAIICMKPDGTIHLWNHKAEEMFGYTAGEAIGQDMHRLIAPVQYRGKQAQGLQQFARTGTGLVVSNTLELSALRKDGTEFPVELSVSATNIRGEWHATGIIRDITERKHAEAVLASRARELGERAKEIRCLYDITNLLLDKGLSMEQILDACTQRIPAGWLDPSHVCARIRLGEQVFETANFRETEWQLAAAITVSGVKSGLVEVFYFGEVASGEPTPFLDEEQNLTLSIATQIAQALERRQSEARISKLTRLYATLSHVNATIVHSANQETLFRNICRGAVEHGQFAMAWVGLVDEATRLVKPVCHNGREQGFLNHISISIDAPPENQGPTSAAIHDNRVCYINDCATDEHALPWREAALERGFRSSVGLPLRLKGRVIGSLTIYSGEPGFFDAEQLALMDEMSNDISFALDNFEREAQRHHAEEERGAALAKLRKALEGSVLVAASITEKRDPYTAGHQQRVSQLAAAIAEEMQLDAARIEGIRFGSLIHDIGKIGVPAEILSKPSILTPLEVELIQTHPKAGYDIIKEIDFPWPVAQMILQHHERLDGSGYPAGLKDGDILLEARIIAVADTVEAMSSHRPYRPGRGMDAALAEILASSGTRYDKQVVDACVRLIHERGFTFSKPQSSSSP